MLLVSNCALQFVAVVSCVLCTCAILCRLLPARIMDQKAAASFAAPGGDIFRSVAGLAAAVRHNAEQGSAGADVEQCCICTSEDGS